MAKYLFGYHGGKMGATPEEQKAIMDTWMAWFGILGDKLVDSGSPLMPAKIVSQDDIMASTSTEALTGYSVVEADSVDAACEIAKGCPLLADGGMVEVFEPAAM